MNLLADLGLIVIGVGAFVAFASFFIPIPKRGALPSSKQRESITNNPQEGRQVP